MLFEPLSDLVFVHMPGCAACEEAAPEVDKFAATSGMMVVRVRADGPMVEKLLGRMRIKATPTYVFRRDGRGFTHEGGMSAKEIAAWIEAIVKREEGDDDSE